VFASIYRLGAKETVNFENSIDLKVRNELYEDALTIAARKTVVTSQARIVR
jgi:hypothetical protein